MSSTVTNEKASEPVASLPSGEPIDSAIPPSSSSSSAVSPPKKPAATKGSIASLVAATPSAVDTFLTRLHRIASTRSGADTVLFFLTYSARLSSNLLETASRAALRNSANKLVALALQLPPSSAVSFASSSAHPVASPVIGRALNLAARLTAACTTLSDVRTFGRLWGLLGLYFAAKKLVLSRLAAAKKSGADKPDAAAAESRFDTLVAAAQILALISYQTAENVAYLSSRKVLGFSPAAQSRLAVWSVRSWALYVGMELGRLAVERQRRLAAAGGALTAKDAEWSAAWSKDFFRNLAWAPITVHWSVANGPLSELAISLLAFYPAVAQMRDVWRANA
ncbi:hypothetical protein ACO1O0_007991 [Amphichorda felina]